jgi:DNA-directed RNA polymerase subunit RPC12/RpoP
MTFIRGEAAMYKEPETDHDEGDTCPYCGDGPLHDHEGHLQCPNCGSSID